MLGLTLWFPPITGKCRKEGSWTAKVTFDSDEMEFPVNATVALTCNEGTDPGPFNATCNMTKDYGAAWDISRVKCLRECTKSEIVPESRVQGEGPKFSSPGGSSQPPGTWGCSPISEWQRPGHGAERSETEGDVIPG